MRLLLVEDSDDLRHLFGRALRRGGHQVLEAANGQEALDCLAGFRPEAVLTDLMMPVVDGFALIRRLRAMPGLAGLPIVAMTAADAAEAGREAAGAGASALLAKPVGLQTLLDRVAGLR